MCGVTRVAVVGAGIMGCATAAALAARGARVTLHEQFALEHARGSSHGRTRIVRLAYPEPAWVRLAAEARAGWARLEAETGERLLELVGLVELAAGPELTSQAGLGAEDAGHRFLDEAEARELGVALPDGWSALLDAGGGFIRADRAREAFLSLARSRGVRVDAGARVRAVDELDADAVVLTVGAWLRRLVPDVPVRVTRETVVYLRRDGAPLPSLVERGGPTGGHVFYALHDPVHGVKAGIHHGGVEADADEPGEPDAAVVERVVAWAAERLPGVVAEPAELDTCLYTTTADESFVLERRGRVVVGSACSGHGFKFAPLVGERLAELALG
jgi:sarcosine oxidase